MLCVLQAYVNRPRERWILEWPGQVVIAVGQVRVCTHARSSCQPLAVCACSCCRVAGPNLLATARGHGITMLLGRAEQMERQGLG